ncbi:MAG: hypothetical protein Q9165_002242 [Trypethelium subeluteriae]
MHTLPASPIVHGSINGESRASQLPLNLIALIITHIDDVADLARVTRASRVLHYMTIPRLYENVNLRSYDHIRYVDGRPEGFGSGSPFAMALNGLVTRSVTDYIKHFRLWGDWREADLQHLAKGRIPDSSLLLNVVVRAAIDKMPMLESFSWELNTKPLKCVYQGLAARSTLRALKIRFPSTRMPRPAAIIPPMPNLRSFTALDIDPLCYPDDMSIFLSQSKKLESLVLHFHPRIREKAEPSVSLDAIFGLCAATNQPLKLRHFALHNLYAAMNRHLQRAINTDTLESETMLNCGGTSNENPMTVFLDETWRLCEPDTPPLNLKQIRCDFIDKSFPRFLAEMPSLERIYLVSARRQSTGDTSTSTASQAGSSSLSTHASPLTPDQTPPEASPATASLAAPYLNSITARHGANLTHLLLSHHWTLGADEIGQLVRGCPNLTQLGISMHDDNVSLLRLLIPFLTKLVACRMLMDPASPSLVQQLESIDVHHHEVGMGLDMAKDHFERFRWVGVGRLCFEVGQLISETVVGEDGVQFERKRRVVKGVPYDVVKDIAIWKMDSHEIDEYPLPKAWK